MIKAAFRTNVIMAFLTALSLINSLLLQMTIAHFFGAGWETDAYLVAYTIPFLVNTLFSEPLGLAMLPTMYMIKANCDNEFVRRFVMGIFVSLVLVVMALMTFLFIGAHWLVRASAPGFSAEQIPLTVWMFRVFILAAGFSILVTFLQYLYYFENSVVWPYFLTLVPPWTIFGCILLFAHVVGIKVIALGALVASAFQCAALGPVLLKYWGVKPTFTRDILRTYKNAILIAFSMAPMWAIPFVDRYLASGMPEGSISYLGYSWTLAVAVASLLSRGALVTFFPELSKQSLTNNLQKLALRLTEFFLFLTISAVVVCEFFIYPAVQVLLMRGQFTIQDVRNVTALLQWHLISVVGIVLINIANRVEYARGFANLSAFMSFFHIMFYITAAVVLMRYFALIGIAVANATSWSLTAVFFMVLLARRNAFEDVRRLIRSALTSILAGACLFLTLSLGVSFIRDDSDFLLFLGAAGGAMGYLLLSVRFLARIGIGI
jgi:putative peptidoglycan lipid II flippase